MVVVTIVHPGVRTDLFDRWSVGTVVSEELQDEVLELGRKALPARLLPVGVAPHSWLGSLAAGAWSATAAVGCAE